MIQASCQRTRKMNNESSYRNYFYYEIKISRLAHQLYSFNNTSLCAKIYKALIIAGQLFFTITLVLGIWIDTLYFSENLKNILEKTYQPMLYVMVLVKWYFILKHIKTSEELFIWIVEEKAFEPKSPDEQVIVEKTMRFYKTIKNVFIWMAISSYIMYMLLPLIKMEQLPNISWYPYDITIRRLYWISFVQQCVGTFLYLLVLILPEIQMVGFTLFIGLQYDLISYNLTNLKNTDSLKEIVIWHCKVIRYVCTISKNNSKHNYTGYPSYLSAANLAFTIEHDKIIIS